MARAALTTAGDLSTFKVMQRIGTQPAASIRALAATVLLGAALACAPSDDVESAAADTPDSVASGPVRVGIEVLLTDSLGLVRGKRVGLITNQTGLGRVRSAAGGDSLVSTVKLLDEHPDLDLVALFSPEHGLVGTLREGEKVASGRHEESGLPIYSLYGETQEPLPAMLEGVDVLMFDIQDVGARYYTYVWTMALAMRAAGAAEIPFVVLDRPNPLGGTLVQGNVLDPAFATFVGLHPVPMRHGMTVAEMARLVQANWVPGVELHVVPMQGWRRSMRYEETGLDWVAPSPNMPSVESAAHYPGTCLFEGTNLSVGRGTERPFQWIGAPWVDGEVLAARLNGYNLPGVRFEPAVFTPQGPSDAKYPGIEVRGVRFVMTDPSAYDPTRAAAAALVEARRLAAELPGDPWEWNAEHFDRLAGTDELRRLIDEGWQLNKLTERWSTELETFEGLRQPNLIYR
jgi:uncharacterized protein YbbC (DUF1343 family)